MVICVVFYQAEDGIRDLVRSRGLGDVYKRQDVHRAGGVMAILGELDRANLLNRGLPMVHAKSLELSLIHI